MLLCVERSVDYTCVREQVIEMNTEKDSSLCDACFRNINTFSEMFWNVFNCQTFHGHYFYVGEIVPVHMWIVCEFRAQMEVFSSLFLQEGSQGLTQVAKVGNKQLCQLRYLIGLDF